jgi:hypothetical protein
MDFRVAGASRFGLPAMVSEKTSQATGHVLRWRENIAVIVTATGERVVVITQFALNAVARITSRRTVPSGHRKFWADHGEVAQFLFPIIGILVRRGFIRCDGRSPGIVGSSFRGRHSKIRSDERYQTQAYQCDSQQAYPGVRVTP